MASHIERRKFLATLGGAAAWPLAARAQQAATPVIGILSGQSPEAYEPFLVPFRQGLNETGFVESGNVAIESRWAQGRYDRLPDLADVLVSRQVALIYAIGSTEAAVAAKTATQTIPIVFTNGSDPVKTGLVASLNRPGGNVTGTSFYTAGLAAKRLELLHELAPRASVMAVLVQTGSVLAEEQLSDLKQAANALRLRLVVLTETGDADLEPAFANVVREGVGALCVTGSAFFTSRGDKIAALAASRSHDLCPTGASGGRRTDQLRGQYGACLSACGRVRGPHPQGRETGRSAGGVADQIRAGDQPQDRQGARPRSATDAARPRRRGDRVM
jgi:putative tryptophan/tyrosine transport system substrate-binding protein